MSYYHCHFYYHYYYYYYYYHYHRRYNFLIIFIIGVYFERILKNSGTSLWMRNIQMGISSIILGFVGVFLSGDGPVVMEKGFFYGYTYVVVAVILLQVCRLMCIYVGTYKCYFFLNIRIYVYSIYK
jgi:hypothetical protein